MFRIKLNNDDQLQLKLLTVLIIINSNYDIVYYDFVKYRICNIRNSTGSKGQSLCAPNH